jgi:hypothetical protein
MKVGQLAELLTRYDEEAEVVLFYDGATRGGIGQLYEAQSGLIVLGRELQDIAYCSDDQPKHACDAENFRRGDDN